MNDTGATKFKGIVEALNAGDVANVGLNTYRGASDLPKFLKKYGNNLESLHYSQVFIARKGVKYRTSLMQV